MEDLIILTVKSLPKTLLVFMSLGFLALVVWLAVFVSRRTAAVLTAITTMLGKLEVAVEVLKANQENNAKWMQRTDEWLKRHDDEFRDLRMANANKGK